MLAERHRARVAIFGLVVNRQQRHRLLEEIIMI
jgi:hypothetical protein